MNFWYLIFAFVQKLIEFFGWWIVLGMVWHGFEPDLGARAVLVTGFGAMVCTVGIHNLLNHLY